MKREKTKVAIVHDASKRLAEIEKRLHVIEASNLAVDGMGQYNEDHSVLIMATRNINKRFHHHEHLQRESYWRFSESALSQSL